MELIAKCLFALMQRKRACAYKQMHKHAYI